VSLLQQAHDPATVKQKQRAAQRTLSVLSKLSAPGALCRDDERPNSTAALLVDPTACGGCCVPMLPASASMSCTLERPRREQPGDKNERAVDKNEGLIPNNIKVSGSRDSAKIFLVHESTLAAIHACAWRERITLATPSKIFLVCETKRPCNRFQFFIFSDAYLIIDADRVKRLILKIVIF
jgi:hypothetical protein